MAWNPSPEVQVARDAARAIEKIRGGRVDICIVIYGRSNHTDQVDLGYASFGTSKVLCGLARRYADIGFEAISAKFDEVCEHTLRMDGRASDGSGIDFDALEAEVVGKLRLLKASLGAMDGAAPEIRRAYVRDLMAPAAELLGRFCECVNIEESQGV